MTRRAVLGALAIVCSIDAVDPIVFGAYAPLTGAPLSAIGAVRFTCFDVGLGSSVMIDLGPGGAGSYAPRRLSAGGSTLDYNLYLDAGHSTVWGDGTQGTARGGPYDPPIIPQQQTITIFGEVPGGQAVPAGSYVDSVVVTLNF